MVTGLAALVVAVAAWWGLRTWRRQLRGQTEYDLARRTLAATYKVRDQIAWVRNPGITGGEISTALKSGVLGDTGDAEPTAAQKQEAVYQNRWLALAEASSALQLELLEGEVHWPKRIRELFPPLHACVSELFYAVNDHLRIERGGERPGEDNERLDRLRRVLYIQSAKPEEDEFAFKILKVVKSIEEFLRPKLKL